VAVLEVAPPRYEPAPEPAAEEPVQAGQIPLL